MANNQGGNQRPSQGPTSRENPVEVQLSVQHFSKQVEKFRGQYDRLIPTNLKLGNVLTADRVLGMLVNLYRTNEDIRACDFKSVVNAAGLACAVGLDFNTASGHSAIIPYKGEATWQPMYKGLVTLAHRSGRVKSVSGHIVMPDDFFEYEYGSREDLRHRPAPRTEAFDIDSDWAYAYAILHYKDGGNAFFVMHKVDVLNVRDKASKAKDNPRGPWRQWPEPMCIKTAAIQLLKWQDLTTETAVAVGRDEALAAGKEQDVVLEWDAEDGSYRKPQTQTQGYGDGANTKQANGNGNSDTGSRLSADTKGPFSKDMFQEAEFKLFCDLAYQSPSLYKNQAQVIGFLARWAGTYGEALKQLEAQAQDEAKANANGQ